MTPDGKGDVFYSGEETHIRALALDGKGNLLAGTEPNGLVLRIRSLAAPRKLPRQAPPARVAAAYVVYETSKREITALVPDAKGNLYVAAIGDKTRPPVTPALQPHRPHRRRNSRIQAGSQNGNITITVSAAPNAAPQPVVTTTALPSRPLASTSVYRIAADDSPEEIWTARDDLVYALGLSAAGKLAAGHRQSGRDHATRRRSCLLAAGQDRVRTSHGFRARAERKGLRGHRQSRKSLLAGTGARIRRHLRIANFRRAHLFALGTTDVGGARTRHSELGCRALRSQPAIHRRAGQQLEPWSGPTEIRRAAKRNAPAARFVQWKAVLHGGKHPAPEVSWVSLAYLPKNHGAAIDAIAMQNPGVRVAGFGATPATGTRAASGAVANASGAPAVERMRLSTSSARKRKLRASMCRRKDRHKRATRRCYGPPKTPMTTI